MTRPGIFNWKLAGFLCLLACYAALAFNEKILALLTGAGIATGGEPFHGFYILSLATALYTALVYRLNFLAYLAICVAVGAFSIAAGYLDLYLFPGNAPQIGWDSAYFQEAVEIATALYVVPYVLIWLLSYGAAKLVHRLRIKA